MVPPASISQFPNLFNQSREFISPPGDHTTPSAVQLQSQASPIPDIVLQQLALNLHESEMHQKLNEEGHTRKELDTFSGVVTTPTKNCFDALDTEKEL